MFLREIVSFHVDHVDACDTWELFHDSASGRR